MSFLLFALKNNTFSIKLIKKWCFFNVLNLELKTPAYADKSVNEVDDVLEEQK